MTNAIGPFLHGPMIPRLISTESKEDRVVIFVTKMIINRKINRNVERVFEKRNVLE